MLRAALTLRGALAAVALATLAQGSAADTSQLIVKFKSDGAKAQPSAHERVKHLAASTGIALAHVREMALGAHVMALGGNVTNVRAEELARAVAADSSVEYAGQTIRSSRRRFPTIRSYRDRPISCRTRTASVRSPYGTSPRVRRAPSLR